MPNIKISTANFKRLAKAKLITAKQYKGLRTKQQLALAALSKAEVSALISIRGKIPTFKTIVKKGKGWNEII
jgi:hypothetical protein